MPRNGLGAQGAAALAPAAAASGTLRLLDLSLNEIGDEGVCALARAFGGGGTGGVGGAGGGAGAGGGGWLRGLVKEVPEGGALGLVSAQLAGAARPGAPPRPRGAR